MHLSQATSPNGGQTHPGRHVQTPSVDKPPPQAQAEAAALQLVKDLDKAAWCKHIAKRILWLEDNHYPTHLPRKHWPHWFHKDAAVPTEDIKCMKCLAEPTPNLQKPVWQVRHIYVVTYALRILRLRCVICVMDYVTT